MQRSLRVLLVGACVSALFAVTPAGAVTGSTCATFRGNATVSPGLPKVGSTDQVRPAISINRAKLTGCHGGVSSATASATLKFDHATNCTQMIAQITSSVTVRAKGKLTFSWNNKRTSTVSFALLFGAIKGEPSVAKVTGTVTAGLFKGAKETGSLYWALSSSACFGGSPLTSFTFSEFSPFVTT
jgi:hypothetical protein